MPNWRQNRQHSHCSMFHPTLLAACISASGFGWYGSWDLGGHFALRRLSSAGESRHGSTFSFSKGDPSLRATSSSGAKLNSAAAKLLLPHVMRPRRLPTQNGHHSTVKCPIQLEILRHPLQFAERGRGFLVVSHQALFWCPLFRQRILGTPEQQHNSSLFCWPRILGGFWLCS